MVFNDAGGVVALRGTRQELITGYNNYHIAVTNRNVKRNAVSDADPIIVCCP
jgi:hypothetical protein